jgi:Protein of unknown function (DUF1460)
MMAKRYDIPVTWRIIFAMISRRIFLSGLLAVVSSLALPDAFVYAEAPTAFKGREVFERILQKADSEKWKALPLGELMGKIALELKGTPYVAGTLELSADKEVCSVDLTGLDCVTFFETTLDFARMLKKGGRTPEALLAEIKLTRYRGGAPGDYSSRLHYTKDWLYDNENKHVIKVLSTLPGAEPFSQKVGFMTNHPDSYKQLAAHPDLIPSMKRQESIINCRSLTFIPLDKIAKVESMLKTGDIVGVCTSTPGIDIAHTGLVFRDGKGIAHFMDASSKKNVMKVTIEPLPISETFTWSKSLTGAVFARPLEVGE